MQLTGNITDYFIVFLSGVAVSFTPCVYPVMPITASILAGVNAKGSKWFGFVLSVIYVFGLALTYCSFAVFAALSGKVFGQIQNSPWFYFAISAVMAAFTLVMFDVFPLDSIGLSIQNKIKAKNIGTIVVAGIISGVAVGPCTAPVLGALLLHVAQKQNLFYAVSLLFVFSYGVGFSLILVGTFSNILGNLPKSGKWMLIVKRVCGLALAIICIYYLVKGINLLL